MVIGVSFSIALSGQGMKREDQLYGQLFADIGIFETKRETHGILSALSPLALLRIMPLTQLLSRKAYNCVASSCSFRTFTKT